MKKKFTGSWAVFDNENDTLKTVEALRQQGYQSITIHSPYPLPEKRLFATDPKNPIALLTLIGAVAGFIIAILFMAWSALDWIIPLSAKPIISIPVMIPVAFEVTILSAVLMMLLALISCITVSHFRYPKPFSQKYQNYCRFTDDRFGIVVPCSEEQFSALENLFRNNNAEEVEIEN